MTQFAATAPRNDVVHIVVMGVAGSGKTTLARLLAATLEVPDAEADDFHPPANIEKMSAGLPLEDADRWPWLSAIRDWMGSQASEGTGTIVTCSALKRVYRDVLRATVGDVLFLHVTGTVALIGDRLEHRQGHFMPASLLPSQFATLEPLEVDEPGVVLPNDSTPGELLDRALAAIQRHREAIASGAWPTPTHPTEPDTNEATA